LKNAVLDSDAVLAFLFKENGHETVLDLLEKAMEADKKLLIASPNWAEIRYMVERRAGIAKWAEVRAKLLGLPVDIIDIDQSLAEAAGALKASHKMSLADCFAAALAKQSNADIYSGDREFKTVESDLKIMWL